MEDRHFASLEYILCYR